MNNKETENEVSITNRAKNTLTIYDNTWTIIDGVIYTYKGNESIVEVPEGVTTIGNSAFRLNTKMEKVILPSTVKTIESYAFCSCTSLHSINFPDSLKTIEFKSFTHTKLKNIILPKNLTYIDRHSFYENEKIDYILIPNLKCIHGYANNIGKSINTVEVYYDTSDDLDILKDIIIDYKPKVLRIHLKGDDFKSILKTFNNYANYILNNNLEFIYVSRVLKEIVFDRPLTLKEKFAIWSIIFCKIKYDPKLNEEIKKEEKVQTADTEINSILEKIDELLKDASEEEKSSVNNKINKLLANYKNSLKNLKPKLTLSTPKETSLTLTYPDEINDPQVLKLNLISKLEMIKYSFSSHDEVRKYLNSLQKYEDLLGDDTEHPEKEDSIENKIRFIQALYEKYEVENTLFDLKNTISTTKNKILDYLNSIFDENILQLTNFNITQIKLEFEAEIERIYNKAKTYYDILSALNGVEETELGEDIHTLRLIIENLDDSVKNKVEDFLNQKIEFYKNNDLNENYRQIEIDIRKQLNDILEYLNPIVSTSIAKKHQFDFIEKCHKLTNEETVSKDKPNACVDTVKDIYSSFKDLDQNEQEFVLEELNRIINLWKYEIENSRSSSVVDELIKAGKNFKYLSEQQLLEFIEYTILRRLYDLKFQIDEYIENNQNYKKYQI